MVTMGTVALMACGGNEKPPLTPDGVDPLLERQDSDAAALPPNLELPRSVNLK